MDDYDDYMYVNVYMIIYVYVHMCHVIMHIPQMHLIHQRWNTLHLVPFGRLWALSLRHVEMLRHSRTPASKSVQTGGRLCSYQRPSCGRMGIFMVT